MLDAVGAEEELVLFKRKDKEMLDVNGAKLVLFTLTLELEVDDRGEIDVDAFPRIELEELIKLEDVGIEVVLFKLKLLERLDVDDTVDGTDDVGGTDVEVLDQVEREMGELEMLLLL